MKTEKQFNNTISYYKLVTLFALVMCAVLMPFKSFDPMGADGLEGMIMNDLYGSKNMPPEARPAFEFAFILFDLLSLLSLAAQWLVIKNALAQKQKWAFHYMILLGVFWPIGACVVSVVTGAYSYLVSAGMITLLFSTPLLVLYKYFK